MGRAGIQLHCSCANRVSVTPTFPAAPYPETLPANGKQACCTTGQTGYIDSSDNPQCCDTTGGAHLRAASARPGSEQNLAACRLARVPGFIKSPNAGFTYTAAAALHSLLARHATRALVAMQASKSVATPAATSAMRVAGAAAVSVQHILPLGCLCMQGTPQRRANQHPVMLHWTLPLQSTAMAHTHTPLLGALAQMCAMRARKGRSAVKEANATTMTTMLAPQPSAAPVVGSHQAVPGTCGACSFERGAALLSFWLSSVRCKRLNFDYLGTQLHASSHFRFKRPVHPDMLAVCRSMCAANYDAATNTCCDAGEASCVWAGNCQPRLCWVRLACLACELGNN